MTPPRFLDDLYSGTIIEKINRAHLLYDQIREELVGDDDFVREFNKLKKLQAQLVEVMSGLNLGVLCSACGSQDGGGCCSAYMSAENDVVQLLFNLVAGIEVASQHSDGAECCFLGERGCMLLFKPMFCLNYNCRQIKDASSFEQMAELEQAGASLLRQQYLQEQVVLTMLRGG
jgi:hypothetical protein